MCDTFYVLKPLKKAVRAVEHTIHLDTALNSVVEDGIELLHVIEATEHEKAVIRSSRKRRRRKAR